MTPASRHRAARPAAAPWEAPHWSASVRKATVREVTVEETAVPEAPVPESPVPESPVREAPAREAAVAPVREAPVREAPVREAAVAPVREAPVREAPAREARLREAPAREAPVREAPAREAALREAALREAAVPEAAVREATVEEVAVPEASVPQAAVKEASVQKVAVPDAPVRDEAGAAGEAGALSFKLAGGSFAPPTWSHEDTVTSLAIPAMPEDWQALRYRATAWSDESEPAGHRRRGYQPPSKRRGPWLRRIIVGVLVAMVAVGGSAGGLLLTRAYTSRDPAAGPSNFKSGQRPGSPGLVSPDSAARVSGSAPGEQQAAETLAALLSQSVVSRALIDRAFNDVRRCGPRLAQDQTTFLQAVAARQDLLGRLVSLPDGATLPAGAVGSLTLAWQAAISADRDFAAWAQDESAKCTPNGRDASLSAATALLNQALRDKAAFVIRWDPVARHYGLRAYTWEQL